MVAAAAAGDVAAAVGDRLRCRLAELLAGGTPAVTRDVVAAAFPAVAQGLANQIRAQTDAPHVGILAPTSTAGSTPSRRASAGIATTTTACDPVPGPAVASPVSSVMPEPAPGVDHSTSCAEPLVFVRAPDHFAADVVKRLRAASFWSDPELQAWRCRILALRPVSGSATEVRRLLAARDHRVTRLVDPEVLAWIESRSLYRSADA